MQGAAYAGGFAPHISSYGELGAYGGQGAHGAPQGYGAQGAYGRPGAYPEEPQAPGYGLGERSGGGEAAYGPPQVSYGCATGVLALNAASSGGNGAWVE